MYVCTYVCMVTSIGLLHEFVYLHELKSKKALFWVVSYERLSSGSIKRRRGQKGTDLEGREFSQNLLCRATIIKILNLYI